MFSTSTRTLVVAAMAAGGLAVASPAQAQTIDPFYAGSYTLTDLGTPAGVPPLLGGLTFLAGDLNTLLIGGEANGAGGAIYRLALTRDMNGHITGFGPATLFSTAPFIDGGLSYGPGGVLFYTAYPTNELGQIKPGSTTPDKVIDLTPLGVSSSVGSLAFVPAGFPGAGQFKILSYSSNDVYTATLTADGTGTYDVGGVTAGPTLSGGLEGIAYVPLGSALFPVPSALVSEYGAGSVAAYELDANGDPIPGTRKDFITGLGGAEGALIDPITGDFLFSTFGGGDRIIRVSGFAPQAVPAPAALPLAAAGGLGLLAGRRLRRRAAC